MFTKLAKLLSPSRRKEEGFTLIELLIVVAIIAILAAIAIPQFGAYRVRGYNAAATSDLRTIRTSEEAMMADFNDYGASSNVSTTAAGTAGTEVGPAGSLYLIGGKTSSTSISLSLSPNVYAGVKGDTNTSGTPRSAYTAGTTHANGDNYYAADSDDTIIYRGLKTTAALTYTAGNTIAAVPASTAATKDITGTCATCAAVWTSLQ